MKSYDVTIQMKVHLYFHMVLFSKKKQNEIWKSGRNLPLAGLFIDWIGFHLVHLLPLVLTSNYN